MSATDLLLGVVTLERIYEMRLSARHTRALLAEGAHEVAPEHYSLVVVLHASWLAGLWIDSAGNPLRLGWLIAYLALFSLRAWVIATLGRLWTTRILILPDAPPVTRGPYRFFAHPNYLVVIGEIAVLPLCLGMPWYALLFSVANGVVLAIRRQAEASARRGSRYDFPDLGQIQRTQ